MCRNTCGTSPSITNSLARRLQQLRRRRVPAKHYEDQQTRPAQMVRAVHAARDLTRGEEPGDGLLSGGGGETREAASISRPPIV